jgi:hypothetical protein
MRDELHDRLSASTLALLRLVLRHPVDAVHDADRTVRAIMTAVRAEARTYPMPNES